MESESCLNASLYGAALYATLCTAMHSVYIEGSCCVKMIDYTLHSHDYGLTGLSSTGKVPPECYLSFYIVFSLLP